MHQPEQAVGVFFHGFDFIFQQPRTLIGKILETSTVESIQAIIGCNPKNTPTVSEYIPDLIMRESVFYC